METQTALVGTNGAVELYAVTRVDMHFTFVVDPGHTEYVDALGLYETLNNTGFLEFGMLVVHILDRNEHFFHCLKELRLV